MGRRRRREDVRWEERRRGGFGGWDLNWKGLTGCTSRGIGVTLGQLRLRTPKKLTSSIGGNTQQQGGSDITQGLGDSTRPIDDEILQQFLPPTGRRPKYNLSQSTGCRTGKISSFYELKELEIYSEVSELLKEQEEFEAKVLESNQTDGLNGSDGNGRPRAFNSDRPRQSSIFRPFVPKGRRPNAVSRSIDESVKNSDDDDDENTVLRKLSRPNNQQSKSTFYDSNNGAFGAVEDMHASTEALKSARRNSYNYEDYTEQEFNAIFSSRITLKKRAVGLYVKSKYLQDVVAPAYAFRPETLKHIEENIFPI
ncbi:hypothetical protein SBOR_6917 [Sclerotinia borealis F-4128]|uniref:Uncharacterized protein n=1 Tax=Sclerotinia borealis (strain F-4128) TaxID=1432307 RepID=W9CDR9_SCLBF|nr:hypothetical protein SBOR_6917 [Sclerotinia borealis F-4128]